MIERRVHMPQLVFLHGPGAGGCAEAFHYQLNSFPGSLAPTLPGHGTGASCVSVERYTEWVQGWLWAPASVVATTIRLPAESVQHWP